MGTTYVYIDTNIDAATNLALTLLGPQDLTSAKLDATWVGTSEKKKLIMSVPRDIADAMYILETSFSIDSTYIVSLQLMLRGHGLGSMIWRRWRKADQEVGYWLTDYQSHDTWINARSHRYHFIVTGQKTRGYDDVYLELSVA